MRIEGFSTAGFYLNNVNGKVSTDGVEISSSDDFTDVMSTRESSTTVNISRTTSKQIMQDYAEYYFKAGRSYEEVRSYRQALSAYERSNTVSPATSSAVQVDNLRGKIFGQ